MHGEEAGDPGHRQEMHEPRALEAAEQRLQRVGLHRLPQGDAGGDHQDEGREHAPVERLLHRVVLAEPVLQPEAGRGDEVPQEAPGSDGQEIAPKMARDEPVDEEDEERRREQPHAGEMPEQRGRHARVAVQRERFLDAAVEQRPFREAEGEDRLGVVDPPAAGDHHRDRQGHAPMRDPHRQGMRLDALGAGLPGAHATRSRPEAFSTAVPSDDSRKAITSVGSGRRAKAVTAIT